MRRGLETNSFGPCVLEEHRKIICQGQFPFLVEIVRRHEFLKHRVQDLRRESTEGIPDFLKVVMKSLFIFHDIFVSLNGLCIKLYLLHTPNDKWLIRENVKVLFPVDLAIFQEGFQGIFPLGPCAVSPQERKRVVAHAAFHKNMF